MKFYYDVLSKKLLDKCKDDLLDKKNKHIWGSSSFDWHPDLLSNIHGSCLFTHITDSEIINLLTKELFSDSLKNFSSENVSYQYYAWNSYSGIAYHNDDAYRFGATIYLNTNMIENGGLFCWKDKYCGENFYKCLNPQENMMVLNDNEEDHFVTTVSPHIDNIRYTIQIFAR